MKKGQVKTQTIIIIILLVIIAIVLLVILTNLPNNKSTTSTTGNIVNNIDSGTITQQQADINAKARINNLLLDYLKCEKQCPIGKCECPSDYPERCQGHSCVELSCFQNNCLKYDTEMKRISTEELKINPNQAIIPDEIILNYQKCLVPCSVIGIQQDYYCLQQCLYDL